MNTLLVSLGICLLIPFCIGLGYALAGEILNKEEYTQIASRYLLTIGMCAILGSACLGVGL